MTTNIEKRIRHERRRKGLLVPLLEDLFAHPVEIENEQDVTFVTGLLNKMMARQRTRQEAPLFSPSQLSECLRYVYLLKNHKDLGISKLSQTRIEPNFYFFNGNWLHLKWQYALHKLDQALPDEIFKLIGVEVPIVSKRRDHGGTVDAICLIDEAPVIVDFKGLNVRTFTDITHGTVPESYLIQIPDYAMLHNSQRQNGNRISKGLLVAENKGGPDPKHPIALHEVVIPIELHLPDVRSRLKKLRRHDEDGTIPPPECVSTNSLQFQACPFRKFCREEVREIQRERAKAASLDAEKLKVASPSGSARKRRGTRASRR